MISGENVNGGSITGGYDARDVGTSLENMYHNFNLSVEYLFHTGDAIYTSGTPANIIETGIDYTISGLYRGNIPIAYPFYRIQITSPPNLSGKISSAYIYSEPAAIYVSNVSGIFYKTGYESVDLKAKIFNSDYIYTHPEQVTGVQSSEYWDFAGETYHYDDFSPNKHLLIVYNGNNQDSVDIKNYYLETRTGLSGANELAVYPNPIISGYITNRENYVDNIKLPIYDWITGNQKPIKYVVLMYDLPLVCSGVSGAGIADIISTSIVQDLTFVEDLRSRGFSLSSGSWNNFLPGFPYSVAQERSLISNETFFNAHSEYIPSYAYSFAWITSGFISQPIEEFKLYKYTGTAFLATHVTAANKNDVSGYITNLKRGRASGHFLIRPNDNVNYFLFRNRGFAQNTYTGTPDWRAWDSEWVSATSGKPGIESSHLLTGSGSSADWPWGIPRLSGQNLAGFAFNGAHSSYADLKGPFGQGYPFPIGLYSKHHNPSTNFIGGGTSGTLVQFYGENWYIMQTAESYNGTCRFHESPSSENGGSQGNIFWWFASGAFSSTASAIVSPYKNVPVGAFAHIVEPGHNRHGYQYFNCWISGLPFIEAANYSNTHLLTTWIGDPFVKFR